MAKYFKAIVLKHTVLNKHFRLLTIDAGRSTLNAQRIPVPGQFYMLQAGDTYDPLLKRPFSIFKTEQQSSRAAEQHDMGMVALCFLYRVRGKGTLSLSHLKSGDIINVIGPLGNSYPEPYGDFIAVAGGIGIASIFPLLEKYKNRAYLFYGARNREELVMLNEVKALSKEIFIATDDGSEGKKGLVTDLLKNFFDASQIPPFPPLLKGGEGGLPIYACGPTPMLRELSKVVAEYPSSLLPLDKGRMGGVKCYVSLEEHMACGVGACLGCAVKVRIQNTEYRSQNNWRYKRVCKEGPVFEIEDIVWE